MGVIWIPGAGQGPWAKCEKMNAVGRGVPLETAWKLRDAKKAKGTNALAINGLRVALPSNERTSMGWQSRRRWQL